MGRFNKYSVVVGGERRAEKKYLPGAEGQIDLANCPSSVALEIIADAF